MDKLFKRIFFTTSILSLVAVSRRFCNAVDLSTDLHYFETLKTSDINRRVRRSIDPHPSTHLHEIWFSSLGRHFHMYVKQTKVVSENFKASVVNSEGVKMPLILDTGNFYTGSLKDDLLSEVQLHWEGDDLHASIKSPDDIIYIEPSWRHLERSNNHSMIVYRQSDLKWRPEDYTAGKKESFCEMKDLRKHEEKFEDDVKLFYRNDLHDNGNRRNKRQTYPYVGTHTMCNLLVVADYYFFQEIGGRDRRITGEYLIGMIGRVNSIYQKTVWDQELSNLGFEIKEMLIHDSYEQKIGDHYNMPNRPNNMDNVLDWFGADHVKLTGFCLAHLFTYQQFPGKLGLAYVGSWRFSDPGGICSYAAYVTSGKKIAVNTGVSTFQNPGGSRALAGQALITVAHELGHNWGSEHDPDTTECAPSSSDNGKFIMYYRATSGYDANNQIFSPCSKRFIFKVVMKKGFDCFKEKSAEGRGLCGNGRQDTGEECDGGYDGDYCCDKACKLRSGAQCSPMNFACCTAFCTVAPRGTTCHESSIDNFDCKGTSNCTGSSYTCPEPVKLSNTRCSDGGTCQNGECKDVCEAVGKTSCLCGGGDSCKKCCFTGGVCAPHPTGGIHQNGRPCNGGFCRGGVCEQSDPPVIKRLFSILDYFSVDKIAKFMRDNLVWTILLFSSIVWIIAIIIIELHDRKESKKEEKVVEFMSPSAGLKIDSLKDVSFIGTRALTPRIRRGNARGRSILEREQLASEAGFFQ